MIPIILSAVLGIIQLLSRVYIKFVERHHSFFVKFGAGIFITLIIMELLPEVETGLQAIGSHSFLLVLLGFVATYAVWDGVGKRKSHKRFKDIKTAGIMCTYFMLGFVLVLISNLSPPYNALEFLVFIPLASYVIAKTYRFHKEVRVSWLRELLVASTPLYGAAIATILNLHKAAFYYAFSFLFGVLFFIALNEVLREVRERRYAYFLLGLAVGFILLLVAHLPV